MAAQQKKSVFTAFEERRLLMEAKKKFIVNVLFYGIIALIVLVLCKYVLPIMTPFVIALVVSAAIHSLTKRMKLKKESIRRLVAVALCAVVYAVVFLGVVFLSAKVVSAVVDVLKRIPQMFTVYILPWLEDSANTLETAVTPYDISMASWIDSIASDMLKSLTQFVTSFSAKAVVWVTSSATAIPSLIVDVIIMVISTFFMVLDFEKVFGFLLKLVPSKKRELFNTGVHYTKTMLLVYIKSYSILFMLTFVELSIGFSILRIPNAIILALIIAVFDLMPILGTGGVLLPWALLMLIMENYGMAFGILVLYLVVTGIRNTLEPRIVGKQIGLHPLATLAAMLLGLRLFGLVGLIGFPVTLTVINAMRRTPKETEKEQPKEETATSV